MIRNIAGVILMKVAVVGATGYAGAELLSILYRHKETEVAYITSESHTGENISDIYPHLRGLYDMTLSGMKDIEEIGDECDAIFIALPHGHAMNVGRALQDKKARIIDLGADYRFNDVSVYEKWYKVSHTHKDAGRVYGLAEIYRDKIKNAKIIGNAGCYTTASILALAPLVKNHLVETNTIIIDAKSGVSGAGRSAKQANLFGELCGSFKAYGVANHRHTPEIEQALSDLSGENILLNFTPHLVPMGRGILATAYANLKSNTAPEDVYKAFYDMYNDEYFIRLLGRGAYPATKNVRGSNFCDIAWHIDERTGRVIVLSVIDNLVKGAAGQAVQNFNIAFGVDEKEGLDYVPVYP